MKLQVVKGATSYRVAVFIQDSSKTDGSGLAGLAYNTSGLKWYYWRQDAGNAGATAVTLATATLGTFTSGGFKEKDATNMIGFYEIGIPDAALASGASWVSMLLYGATNMAPLPIEIQLTSFNPDDSVRLGLTALPNAAAEASGGLFTRGTGAGQINQDANGRIDANQKAIIGTALTETSAGYLAAAFKKLFDVAAPVLTAVSVNQTGDAYARLGAPTGASISADLVTITNYVDSLETRIPATVANLTGDPGSQPAIQDFWSWVYASLHHKVTCTSSQQKVYASDNTTLVGTSSVSDDGTTFTRGKFV